jgi:outer membrane receptor protein involved in Fe transport
VQAIYGRHTRRAVEFEHGRAQKTGAMDWYIAGNLFDEDGWRENSPSTVGQIFGKAGWQRPKTIVNVSVGYADNSLTGNGLQEARLLERDYASIYTKPDVTDNRSTFVNVAGRHGLRDTITLSGTAYYRRIRTSTLNGDVNEASLDEALSQATAAERCIANVLLNDEPGEKCNGLVNRTATLQHNVGASGQMTWLSARDRGRNQFTAGLAYDQSVSDFQQSAELGYVNPDRSITGLGVFADGVSAGDIDGDPFDARVDLDGHTRTVSLYATDTLRVRPGWHATLSARFNRTVVENRDRITPGGGTGSLDGTHTFSRVNPAAGLTIDLPRRMNTYLGYSEGSRAATSIELGCADPEAPCKLPNAMTGDPPLDQVVTRTIEAGVRGSGRARWRVGYFRAENRNDILFVVSEQTGFGYFRNFGRTRRQGVEAGADAQLGRVNLGAGYTFLDATFQSPEAVNGESNSENDAALAGTPGLEGAIEIVPGSRIPMMPRHMLKLFGELRLPANVSVDMNLISTSSSFARGNENNAHEPDGLSYLGPGVVPGYAIVNLGARYQIKPRVGLLLQINNLFDRRYQTAAQLGSVAFTSTGVFSARPLPAVDGEFPLQHGTFYAPGAPLTFWIGTRVTL